MTNKQRILIELDNVEKLAKILITWRDNTGYDEIPCDIYITSDGQEFEDDYEGALSHEIEWLNAQMQDDCIDDQWWNK